MSHGSQAPGPQFLYFWSCLRMDRNENNFNKEMYVNSLDPCTFTLILSSLLLYI